MKAMEAIKQSLDKHKTTRCLFSQRGHPDVDEIEQEMRDCLEWQRRLVNGVLMYSTNIPAALDSLARANEELEAAGIGAAEDVGPAAKLLFAGTLEARRAVAEFVASVKSPLETYRGILDACVEDLYEADRADADMRRYAQKVGKLTGEGDSEGDRDPEPACARHQARVDRNRVKLQLAVQRASVRKTRAEDTLKICVERRSRLCSLAQKVVVGMAEALLIAGRSAEPGFVDGATVQHPVAFTTASRLELPSHTPPTTSVNPFEEDIGLKVENGIVTLPTTEGKDLPIPAIREHSPLVESSTSTETPSHDLQSPESQDLHTAAGQACSPVLESCISTAASVVSPGISSQQRGNIAAAASSFDPILFQSLEEAQYSNDMERISLQSPLPQKRGCPEVQTPFDTVPRERSSTRGAVLGGA